MSTTAPSDPDLMTVFDFGSNNNNDNNNNNNNNNNNGWPRLKQDNVREKNGNY